MLLIETVLKQSTIENVGLGLFTKEYIKKGTVVWRFLEGFDLRFSMESLDGLEKVPRLFMEKYGWRYGNYYYLSCDTSSFMNHSFTPNLKKVNDEVIALRDINIGEELLENYSDFDDDFDEYKDILV